MDYCIIHAEMDETFDETNPYHIAFDDNGFSICDGPFAACPPPTMTEEEWEATFAAEDFALALLEEYGGAE